MRHVFDLVAIALAVLCLTCGPSDSPTGGELSADGSTSDTLDPDEVPERLRHLLPLATQWGIGDDVDRMEAIERSSAAEREALAAALAPYNAQITAWLDSFGANPMPDEAAAFMYMQLALEEMP